MRKRRSGHARLCALLLQKHSRENFRGRLKIRENRESFPTRMFCRIRYNILAHVKWLQDHPQRNCLHDSVIISSNTYENEGPVSFIPVSRMIACCAIAYGTLYRFELEEHHVCISVPLI